MLSREDIQLDLLSKLNELCEKANVKYVLHGQAAFLAYRNESFENLNSLEVMMCQGDAEKIADLLDDDNYYFEDFRVNPKFDKNYMMFGYKNSLDLKLVDLNFMKTRNIKNHCIRINILFIEHPAEIGKGKSLRFKRLLWKFRYLNVNINELWYLKYMIKVINLLYKLNGEKRSIKQRYNLKKENFSIWTWDEIKSYPNVRISGFRGRLNPEIFYDIIPIEFNGVISYIFNDFEHYGINLYGLNWEDKKWKSVKGFNSNSISWEEYIEDPVVKNSLHEIQKRYEYTYAKSSNLKENKYINKIKNILVPKSKKIHENKLIIRNMRKNVIQSGKVIHIREDFIEQKDELIRLYQNKDYDELKIKLKPLIQSMQTGIHVGYCFSVDSDIDKLLDSYLRDVGRDKLADKIQDYRIDV